MTLNDPFFWREKEFDSLRLKVFRSCFGERGNIFDSSSFFLQKGLVEVLRSKAWAWEDCKKKSTSDIMPSRPWEHIPKKPYETLTYERVLQGIRSSIFLTPSLHEGQSTLTGACHPPIFFGGFFSHLVRFFSSVIFHPSNPKVIETSSIL